MQYIATHIASGSWKKTFGRRGVPNPVEADERVCACLAQMFKGHAQAMAFVKSSSGGATVPPTIKARLSVGVMNSMSGAFNQLAAIENAPALFHDLLTHTHIIQTLYCALAYQHAAQAYLEKTEVGNAIAFCMSARVSE